MLCACGAPPFDTAQGVEQPLNGSQAVLPASSFGGDLLYVTNAKKLGPNKYVGLIEVLTFPQGKPYATIHLHGFANGLCTDASGNVWAVAGEKHDWQAYEYAHGGTTPILRIRIKNAHSYAEGCAIDPGSGDLAVLTGAYEGSGIRSYAYIWKGAKPGKPASYPLTFTPAACAYDATGNLFIDGWIGSTVFFALDKLAKGSNAVMKVAIDKALYGYPGGVEWDGTYIDAVSVLTKIARYGDLPNASLGLQRSRGRDRPSEESLLFDAVLSHWRLRRRQLWIERPRRRVLELSRGRQADRHARYPSVRNPWRRGVGGRFEVASAFLHEYLEYFMEEGIIMIGRVPVAAAFMLLSLWGCAQGTAPIPSGVQSNALDLAESARRQAPAVNYFDTPSVGAWPGYIVSGPEKSLWFTEEFTDKIGRLKTDGAITEFPVSNGQEPEGIAVGPDGNLWFTEPGANEIGRMTPQGSMSLFQIDGSNPSPRGITLGPDGNLWFTELYDGYIGRITPQGTITRFQIPVYAPYAWAITTGPDGDLWFTESEADAIGRFNPSTDNSTHRFPCQRNRALHGRYDLRPTNISGLRSVRAIRSPKSSGSNSIREFRVAQAGSYPEDLVLGSDGDVWFTENQTAAIGRINPSTGKFGRAIELPSGSIPNAITSGSNKNVFFTIDSYHNPSQIGELLLH